jgi:hypothetical protein
MKEGIDYRVQSDGTWVFTREFLLKRGFCCGSGCQECPYDFENVPEPKRTEKRMARQKGESRS